VFLEVEQRVKSASTVEIIHILGTFCDKKRRFERPIHSQNNKQNSKKTNNIDGAKKKTHITPHNVKIVLIYLKFKV